MAGANPPCSSERWFYMRPAYMWLFLTYLLTHVTVPDILTYTCGCSWHIYLRMWLFLTYLLKHVAVPDILTYLRMWLFLTYLLTHVAVPDILTYACGCSWHTYLRMWLFLTYLLTHAHRPQPVFSSRRTEIKLNTKRSLKQPCSCQGMW
jgi:hypothetical protein